MRQYIRTLIDHAVWLVSHPVEELTRWQRAARYGYEIVRHGWRQLRVDRAGQMAAALSFRTLFGLLPVLVVMTLVVRAMFGPDEFEAFVNQLVQAVVTSLGWTEAQLVLPPEAAAGAEEAATLTLAEAFRMVVDRVGSLNFAAIGWIGTVLLIYAAISLMGTVEDAFNAIYRVPSGRSWLRRVTLYWFVLTFAPFAMWLSVWVNGQIMDVIETLAVWPWLGQAATLLWSFLILWMLLVVIFASVPNTRVEFVPAATGAFIAAVFLEVVRLALGVFVGQLVTLGYLYGPLGLIPLFMLWVYVVWIIFLLGVEVAAAMQTIGNRPLEAPRTTEPGPALIDPAAVLAAMQYVQEQFVRGRTAALSDMTEETGLPRTAIERMLSALVSAGVLHRVEAASTAVTLARPPESIRADELLAVGFDLAQPAPTSAAGVVLDRLREAQLRVAQGLSLAGLGAIPAGPAPPPSASATPPDRRESSG